MLFIINVRGIKTYLYEPTIDMFMGNPKTGKCDCTNSYKCKNAGVVDLSPCWYKSPLYGSLPHFMGDGFKEIRNSIIGLKPDKFKHRSYLELDPITGSALRGSKRGQMNTYIERISTVRSIRTVRPDLFLPLFWYDESGEINDELESEIKQKSVYPLIIASYMTLFSLIVGSILSCFSCIVCIFCTKKHKKKIQQSNLTNEVYLDKSYEKLTNLDDALSTKTDLTNDSSSSTTSSKQTSTVSIISKNSNNSIDSFKQPGFILVQPIQYDSTSLRNANFDNLNKNNTHSLALIPNYQQNLPSIVNDIDYHQINMSSKLNTQFENLPIVDYKPPSPKTLDHSMRIISKLIELNSKNLIDDQLNLQNENQSNNEHQQDRSINEMQINQSKLKKIKKNSSQEDSSFDFD